MRTRSMPRQLVWDDLHGRRRQHGPKVAAVCDLEQQVNDTNAEQDIAAEQEFHCDAFLEFFNFFGEGAGKPAFGDPVIVFLVNPGAPDVRAGNDEDEGYEGDGPPGEPKEEDELQAVHAMRMPRRKRLKPDFMTEE
jgi:hypothetical protein